MNGKADCEKLMNSLLPLAERMLGDYSEFYPYGGYMKPDGQIVHVGLEDQDTDHPKSKDMLYVLRDSLSKMARACQCKATAIVFDVCVDLPETAKRCDAIQVSVDHADGYSAEVFFPYEIEGSRLSYGPTFAQPGKHEIFGTN